VDIQDLEIEGRARLYLMMQIQLGSYSEHIDHSQDLATMFEN
jgi:hypothetical protein